MSLSTGCKALRVRPAVSEDRVAWDAFVDSRTLAAPYHSYAWGEAVESAYGKRVYRLVAEIDGHVEGVLCAVHMRLPLRPGRLVSLPYCDIGDALATSEEAASVLREEAVRVAATEGARGVELRGIRGEPGGLATEADIPRKVRMVLSLPPSAEALWGGFKSKLRSQIGKAEKNGLLFRWAGRQELDAFYEVFSRNMRDLGSPVHSLRWFRDLLEGYGPRGRTGLVWHEGRPVGGGIVLCTKTVVSIPWASTLREANTLAPNMLLYWKLLEYAAEHGFTRFDFGRSTPGEGTYRFKAQWGAEPEALAWTLRTTSGVCHVADGMPTPNRRRAAAAWARLPVPLANLIGPFVRKRISL
ncbi:MAG: GNAT family N-acetyltransferase [Deferrisomatales bacterium]